MRLLWTIRTSLKHFFASKDFINIVLKSFIIIQYATSPYFIPGGPLSRPVYYCKNLLQSVLQNDCCYIFWHRVNIWKILKRIFFFFIYFRFSLSKTFDRNIHTKKQKNYLIWRTILIFAEKWRNRSVKMNDEQKWNILPEQLYYLKVNWCVRAVSNNC